MIRTTLLLMAMAFALVACSDTTHRADVAPSVPKAAGEVAPEGDPASESGSSASIADPVMNQEGKVSLSEDEWKERLTPEQYRICRECGTEPAFTGKYWNTKTEGTYHCVGCGQALFDSKTKYRSGSGWPSFWQPTNDEAVATRDDSTLGMTRTEILCSKCDAHLGHVFRDGPEPTGLRYCVNSGSLDLEPREKPEK